jgi:hypothetical protein
MKFLREPLIHFLLLGATIFAAFSVVTRHRTDRPREIVISQGTLESMVIGFSRTWQRPPTEGELRGLVRDYIREEAAYREALAMGLERDDTIVRRRLRQKLEFLSDDLASQAVPTDEDLQQFLQSHSEQFHTDTVLSFRHVYLNPQLHGADLKTDVARLLTRLDSSATVDPDSLGDPFLLESHFDRVSLSDVKKTFGEKFSSTMAAATPGQWQGPVESGYGLHLVFISQRQDGQLPALADIRDQVRREWFNARRNEATDKFYEVLLRGYSIKIESPENNKIAQVH